MAISQCKICGTQFANQRNLIDHLYGHVENSVSVHRQNEGTGGPVEPRKRQKNIIKLQVETRATKRRIEESEKAKTLNRPPVAPIVQAENIPSVKPPQNSKNKKPTAKEQLFTCKTCNHNFKTKTILNKHMNTHNVKFQCSLCDHTFQDAIFLRNHMATHEVQRKLSCDICNKMYKNKMCMEKHMHAKHIGKAAPERVQDSASGRFVCQLCNKTFKSSSNLKIHNNLHTDIYVCDICGHRNQTNHHLIQHKIKHKVCKKSKCLLCNKWLKSKYTMRIHNKKFHYLKV